MGNHSLQQSVTKMGFYYDQGFYYNQPDQGFYYDKNEEGFYYEQEKEGFYYDQEKGFYYQGFYYDERDAGFNQGNKDYWYKGDGKKTHVGGFERHPNARRRPHSQKPKPAQ